MIGIKHAYGHAHTLRLIASGPIPEGLQALLQAGYNLRQGAPIAWSGAYVLPSHIPVWVKRTAVSPTMRTYEPTSDPTRAGRREGTLHLR